MISKLFCFTLLLTIATSFPVEQPPRRLDPSNPGFDAQVEDFDNSDPDEIDFEDAPPIVIEAGEEENYEEDEVYLETPRQEAQLEQMSAIYERMNGEASEIFSELQLADANENYIRGSLKENEVDRNDLAETSEWLNQEAAKYAKHAETQSGKEAEDEKAAGEIIQAMADIAQRTSDLEGEIVEKEQRELELEGQIVEAKNDEANFKSEQLELELDNLYSEYNLIQNEREFGRLNEQLQDYDIHVHEDQDYEDQEGEVATEPEIDQPEQPKEAVDAPASPVAVE